LQASPATSPRKSFTFPAGEAPDEDPEDLEDGEHRARLGSAEDWEAEPIDRASLAIAAPAHRDHIKEHLRELMDAVKSMEDKSETLLEVHPPVDSALVCIDGRAEIVVNCVIPRQLTTSSLFGCLLQLVVDANYLRLYM
jgi:hypothetical protein